MKISNFKMEITPFRGPYSLCHLQELRIRIDDCEGQVRETKTVIHPDTLPDEQSLLDYIFERAKSELKDHIVGRIK